MGKKKVAVIDLSQSESAQYKAGGTRDQRIRIKKPELETQPEPEPIKSRPTTSSRGRGSAADKPGPKKKKKRVKHARSQRYQEARAKIDKTKAYPVSDAIKLLKEISHVNFDPTVELHFNLNTDNLSGELTLPHGSGKTKKVEIASDATLVKLKAGKIDFDVLLAEPQIMPKVAQYAKILGPKGLMPNPKAGTVSDKPEELKKKLAGGSLRFRSEAKAPLLHLAVGKLSFENTKLEENIKAAFAAVAKKNIASVFLCSSMSPSIRLKVD